MPNKKRGPPTGGRKPARRFERPAWNRVIRVKSPLAKPDPELHLYGAEARARWAHLFAEYRLIDKQLSQKYMNDCW